MATEVRSSLKRKSHVISDGPDRAPARSMLRAVGLSDEDMDKPFVAVGNLASDVTPCNVHLDRLAKAVKEGVRSANAVPFQFGTITRQRWHFHGDRGYEGVAGEPGGHR